MSVDLDYSTMEEENQAECAECAQWKNECAQWKSRALELEETFKKLEPLARLFGRLQTRGSPTPTTEMCKLLYTELAQG